MIATSDLRKALGCFATGVTVITTRIAERQFGFTANSFTSVSLSPPTILFCIGTARASYVAFRSATSFTVNVLSSSQRTLSDRFATSGTIVSQLNSSKTLWGTRCLRERPLHSPATREIRSRKRITRLY